MFRANSPLWTREAQFGGVSQNPLVEPPAVCPPPPGVVGDLMTRMPSGGAILLRSISPPTGLKCSIALTKLTFCCAMWYLCGGFVASSAHDFVDVISRCVPPDPHAALTASCRRHRAATVHVGSNHWPCGGTPALVLAMVYNFSCPAFPPPAHSPQGSSASLRGPSVAL